MASSSSKKRSAQPHGGGKKSFLFMLYIPLLCIAFFVAAPMLSSVLLKRYLGEERFSKMTGRVFGAPSAEKAPVPKPPPAQETQHTGGSSTLYQKGQIYRHKKHDYLAVIVEAHEDCRAPWEWKKRMKVEELERGAHQPFYLSLVDERDRKKGEMTYVAEENVRILTLDEVKELDLPLRHSNLWGHFSTFDEADGKYI